MVGIIAHAGQVPAQSAQAQPPTERPRAAPSVYPGLFYLQGDPPDDLAWKRLQASSAALDFHLQVSGVRSLSRIVSEALAAGGAHQSKEDSPRWVLTGPQAQCLLRGNQPPTVEALSAALEAAMGPAPTRMLKAFTAQNPEHWGGLQAFATRASNQLPRKLRLIPGRWNQTDAPRIERSEVGTPRGFERLGPVSPTELLSPELDALLWGDWSEAMGRLLVQPEFLTSKVDLWRELPGTLPERFSPSALEMYRRVRPQLISHLRALPEARAGWQALLRINAVLGDAQWPEAHILRLVPDHRLLGSLELGPLLVALARDRASLEYARDALEAIWVHGCLPDLERGDLFTFTQDFPVFYTRFPGRDPLDWRSQQYWEGRLGPLLEVLLRLEDRPAVQALLDSIQGFNAPVVTPGRWNSLLERLRRQDLKRSFRLPDVPPQAPKEQLPAHRQGLLLYGHDGLDRIQSELAARGHPVQVSSVFDPDETRILGWSGSTPRWTLVDRTGRRVLEGEGQVDPETVVDMLRKRGSLPEEDVLRRTLQVFPQLLTARVALLNLIETQIDLASQAPATQSSRGAQASSASLERLISEWLRQAEQLFESPLGRLPDQLWRSGIMVAPAAPAKRQAHEHLVRWLLPRIETDLRRNHTNDTLWKLWGQMVKPDSRRIHAFISTLTPLPAMSPAQPWPPREALEVLSAALVQEERWQDLREFLEPIWFDPHRRGGPSSPNATGFAQLFPRLLEALLRLKALPEATQALDRFRSQSGSIDLRNWLPALSERCGQGDWGRRMLEGENTR